MMQELKDIYPSTKRCLRPAYNAEATLPSKRKCSASPKTSASRRPRPAYVEGATLSSRRDGDKGNSFLKRSTEWNHNYLCHQGYSGSKGEQLILNIAIVKTSKLQAIMDVTTAFVVFNSKVF
ncbi:uncharacterized protein LOC117291628 [Asterias rubens]|uniref:uncharacterized protein LOC117291628 n=1 Tax=Asterias rubens TaxID=7604 RepID=UPI001455BD45|nr:uncharacterized protein LOC117291628 [Asterias rubens]